MNNRRQGNRLVCWAICGALLIACHCAAAQENVKAGAAPAAPTAEEIQTGRQLFQGNTRFAHGGPACISCHHVNNDAVISGGLLAADLTNVISRIGQDGLVGVLPRSDGNSPFPSMQSAFQGKLLTDGEMRALGAFLQQADQQAAAQKPNDFGSKMFLGGLAGVVGMLGLFALLGQGRKRRSVNQEIYDRQLKSE